MKTITASIILLVILLATYLVEHYFTSCEEWIRTKMHRGQR